MPSAAGELVEDGGSELDEHGAEDCRLRMPLGVVGRCAAGGPGPLFRGEGALRVVEAWAGGRAGW